MQMEHIVSLKTQMLVLFRGHKVAKCYKKTAAAAPSQRDIFHKSLHACEASKHVPVVGAVSKQGEGAFLA